MKIIRDTLAAKNNVSTRSYIYIYIYRSTRLNYSVATCMYIIYKKPLETIINL